jgi:hypothetical protein
VDLATNSEIPGVFSCTRDFCENPNASLLSEGLVIRDDAGNLWRPDIWPPYCALGKLASIKEVPVADLWAAMLAPDASTNPEPL